MNNLVEIWRSKLIPEGPMVIRSALPQDVKDRVTTLTADLWETNPECAYNVAAGDAKDFVPVTLDAYEGVDRRPQAAGKACNPPGPGPLPGSGPFPFGYPHGRCCLRPRKGPASEPCRHARGLSRDGPPQADVRRHPACLFIALMAAGWMLAEERNAGDFWSGLPQVIDFPAEVLSEAWPTAPTCRGFSGNTSPP